MSRCYHVTGTISVVLLHIPSVPIGAAIDLIAHDRHMSHAFPAYPFCDYWLVPV